MNIAMLEKLLKTIQQVQKSKPQGLSTKELAEEVSYTQEEVQDAVNYMQLRELVELSSKGEITLTLHGLRRLLTEAIEDYLVTIYRLSQSQKDQPLRVSTSAIAEALGVASPSVTGMIQKKLSKLELVDYLQHQGVKLSSLGERLAVEILRHHRIVELYLTEKLGVPWEQVHEEAQRLEHVMSPSLIERMSDALGNPTVDPHGDPIPRKDGTIVHRGLTPIYEVPIGQVVKVRRVSDQTREVLLYLSEIGIEIGATVQVIDREPFKGPLTISIEENVQPLSHSMAHKIFVEQIS